jgi:hypothetical protein
VTVRFLADENFNRAILVGVQRRAAATPVTAVDHVLTGERPDALIPATVTYP